MIHKVNYRPTSQKHTPKAAGSAGSEASALFCCLCMYVSITCFLYIVISLSPHLSSSLCDFFPSCSFSMLLLSSCFPLPPSLPPPFFASLGTESTQAIGVVETFLDGGVTLYLSVLFVSVCFYLGRT